MKGPFMPRSELLPTLDIPQAWLLGGRPAGVDLQQAGACALKMVQWERRYREGRNPNRQSARPRPWMLASRRISSPTEE